MLFIYWKDCQLQTFYYIRSSFVLVISTHARMNWRGRLEQTSASDVGSLATRSAGRSLD